MPSMPSMPTAQGAVGVAAPTGSRLEPTVRRPDTTASRPAAPADRPATPAGGPATPAGGPKAAKVVTREKLTYARVLLSQRIARTPGSPSGTYATKAGKAVAFARAQLGKPCVWGAAGPGSYDCAGLTQAAWKSAGVTLPRTAREQAGVGVPVPPAEARPGDLVFFHDDADHVGLCTGHGMMIHAPRPGAYVREQPVAALGEGTVHSVVRPG
ncbi:C40 family peptidase [Streptomyces achromogenes]|uniref:C40 family peptidase n=1 Tax=Streptomyces achromogenes TaxID=67255 RepID=UPI00373AF218